jgi:hypothetical protein
MKYQLPAPVSLLQGKEPLVLIGLHLIAGLDVVAKENIHLAMNRNSAILPVVSDFTD